MPIGYRRCERDLTVVAWVGRVDATVWRDHARRIASDPEYPTDRVLVDMREAVIEHIGGEDASSIAGLYDETLPALPLKCATVVRDEGFDLARVFQHRFGQSVDFLVFGDLLSACQWLGAGSAAIDVLADLRRELADGSRTREEAMLERRSDDIWPMIADARADLAEYLATLTRDQWDAASLCAEWNVRDVVGHLVEGTREIVVTDFLLDVVRGDFDINRMIAANAKEEGKKSPEELLNELRAGIDSRIRPPTMSVDSLLAELVVHTQDIRRPLAAEPAIPETRLRIALDRMSRAGPLLGNKERIAGVRLQATDFDWSYGAGPNVVGTGEALLMAMCGRAVALDDVSGDGRALLAERLASG